MEVSLKILNSAIILKTFTHEKHYEILISLDILQKQYKIQIIFAERLSLKVPITTSRVGISGTTPKLR